MTLAEIRKEKDICNARQTAKQLGISYRQYHRIEKGISKLDKAKALKLSQIFGLSVTEIQHAWNEGRLEIESSN